MKVRANAKLNLTLDIIGKREDGYHLLDSVMQEISLCDYIEIEKNNSTEIRLVSDREYLPADIRNTAYRGAKVFFDYMGITSGIDIRIEKKIPSRAGMGGGSADAAAVLKALNVMFETKLSKRTLCRMGLEVGADVPFCIMGGTCRCEGIGEVITRITPMPKCYFVICKPKVGINTARAFAKMDEYEIKSERATPGMVKAIENQDISAIAAGLSNRFDEVTKLWQVQRIKAIMRERQALGTMMTGSGTSVYGIFSDWSRAQKCANSLKRAGEVFITRPWSIGLPPK